MEKELVSIVTPSYNTGEFVAETIQCVLNQTYQNWEMIIIDDCSTDDSVEVINSFDDERIKLFINEKNSGAAISRNKALRAAKGKWIAFLDSDDFWNSDKLKEQIKFMQENEYHFSYTNYIEVDEASESRGRMLTGPSVLSITSFNNFCYPGCLTVMYDAEKVGLVQIENLAKNNDYAIWLKVVKKAKCYLLPKTLASYRKRTGSISNHSYYKLIKYHYYLWKYGEHKNVIVASMFTLRNLIFGMLKKIFYNIEMENDYVK